MKKDHKSTIGIIGFGRFGTLVASVLKSHFEIKVYHHKKRAEDIRKARAIGITLFDLEEVCRCNVIILAVPISQTEKMIKKISPLVRAGSLIVDTCSVKVYPCRWLKKHLPKNVEIMGTHPMFGPVTTGFDLQKQTWKLKNLQIVLSPIRIKKGKLAKIIKFLGKLGLRVIVATPAGHDRQNAYTLGLVHFIGRSLVVSGAKEQSIYTPGYTDMMKIIPHTASDNWQLFFDMHNFNPYAAKIRKQFMKSCEKLDNIINAKKS